MMGDNDLRGQLRQCRDAASDRFDLRFIDTATFEGHGACCVDAEHGNLSINKAGFQVFIDDAPIVAKWSKRPLPGSIQWHIMVASNDNLWCRQTIQKCARLAEFIDRGTLRQITGNDHAIRLMRVHAGNQRFNDRRVSAAEVQV